MRVLLLCSVLVGLSICSPSLHYRDANLIYPGHPSHPNTKNHYKKTGTKSWNRYPSGSPLAFKQQQSGNGQFDNEFQMSSNDQSAQFVPQQAHQQDSITFQMSPVASQASASIVPPSGQPNLVQHTDAVQPIVGAPPSVVPGNQPELETVIPASTIQQTFNHIPSNIAIPPVQAAQAPQPLETIHVPSFPQSHGNFVSSMPQQPTIVTGSIPTEPIQPQSPESQIVQPVIPQQPVINQPTLETIVPIPPKQPMINQPTSSLEVITPQKPTVPVIPLETIHDIKPQVQPQQQFQPQQPIQPQAPIVPPQTIPIQPTIPQQSMINQPTLETIVPIPQKPFVPSTIPLETIQPIQSPQAPIVPQTPIQPQPQIIAQQSTISQPSVTPLETIVAQQQGSCNPNPCKNHGECETRGSSFSCVCPFGFSGQFCEICTTACASSPCPIGKECVARIEGGFDCVCPADRAGPNCELQNDLCSSNPCFNGGQCRTIEGGSFVCDCVQPFAGKQCEQQFQNPCTDEVLRRQEVTHFINPWDRKSFLICTDVNVFQSMKCPIGTHFSDSVHHCVPEGFEPHVCPVNHCLNHAECVIDSQNLAKCQCLKGFSGERCEINIDECALEGNTACAPTGTCIDQINGYFCSCDARNSSIGLNCRDAITNPCTEDNMSRDNMFHAVPSPSGNTYLQCTGLGQFVVSKCAENLFWHSDEQTCSTQPAPLRQPGSVCSSQPCLNGAECTEDASIASYRCLCKTGFAGRNCENTIDYCSSNPCQNGGKCLSYTGGYTCMCADKVIDDCCCHGVSNPCPNRADVIPGINDYFPHVFANRYIHCDMDRRAFVKSCPPKTRWNQLSKTCLPEYTNSVRQSIYQSSYAQPVVQSAPVQAYSSPYTAALPPVTLVQRVSTPVYSALPIQQQAPVRPRSYLAQQPVPPTLQQALPYGGDAYKTLSYLMSPLARQVRHTGFHYNLA